MNTVFLSQHQPLQISYIPYVTLSQFCKSKINIQVFVLWHILTKKKKKKFICTDKFLSAPELFVFWNWIALKRPNRTVTLRCSWTRPTRKLSTDEPWLLRAYRCLTGLVADVGLDRFVCLYADIIFSLCAFARATASQDYLSASSDLQEVLQLDPNVPEAEHELEAVTGLLRQSLMHNAAHTPRVRAQDVPYCTWTHSCVDLLQSPTD